MLDGLIRHRQVLVDGPNPVAEVHLVLGATGVALLGRSFQQTQTGWKEKTNRQENIFRPTCSWWTMNVMSSPGATANICPLMATRSP